MFITGANHSDIMDLFCVFFCELEIALRKTVRHNALDSVAVNLGGGGLCFRLYSLFSKQWICHLGGVDAPYRRQFELI